MEHIADFDGPKMEDVINHDRETLTGILPQDSTGNQDRVNDATIHAAPLSAYSDVSPDLAKKKGNLVGPGGFAVIAGVGRRGCSLV